MKFSELWLREWVNPDISIETLSEQLTMAGIQVDIIEAVSSTFKGVFIGEVMECSHHPILNNLWIIKVNTGSENFLENVCSTYNCRVGLRVAVATIGAVLPGDLKIKESQIAGKPSGGIVCSFSNLGLAEDQDSILALPEDAPVGNDIYEYLQLQDNTIEISVTPNRSDCLSIIGVAREIAALNKLLLREPIIDAVPAVIHDTLSISVEATDACPRYLGRVIKNINLSIPTPLWMRERLRRSGIRSINLVVDVTNYVLIELGQPMHAFDLNRIEGNIVVRMAKDGETLILLNGNAAELSGDTLVIADQKKVLAMGGILGGAYSSINAETENILLECAYFAPTSIIGRARRHSLNTYASHRYERGVDPCLQNKAMERATRLLIDICDCQAGPVINVTNKEALPKSSNITLRRATLDRLIGHHIDDKQVTDILKGLGFKLRCSKDIWQAVAPSWSVNMNIEEDLVEEVVRLYGYNNLPNMPIKADLIMNTHLEENLPLKRVKTMLVDRGYQEAITYSFVDPNMQKLLHPYEDALVLPRPISSEMSAMRLSLWTGLLSAVIYNQNRQQSRVRLFETGLRFVPDEFANLGVRQDIMLAGVITGNRYKEHWNLESQIIDFYDVKGDLESILDLTCKMDEVQFKAEGHPALHAGQSAGIYLTGKMIGFIGVLNPYLEHKLDLNGRAVLFEIVWDAISKSRIPQANRVSRYTSHRRDISIIVPQHIPAGDILSECKRITANKVVALNLFDVYYGPAIIKGYKSLAISLVFQAITRKLEEKEISATVEKCVDVLKQRFSASLRD
ncbi:phenylalanine--tRNA ligase subunit beta [Candidatus Profftia tarda]|uniref:Phenylalanine--tRNA ligase beta subunit n=1 Tax=Candidatus Profftia tarda TaxID=1177216 RepID=A0A8E4GHT3_9ENTR|nr:phenylalanine--tRNA ligase subunit beta [Candidatus Profftia tarda]CAD6510034.1 Phenylalanine--tRNA ligase beta subunit [Candidatus Profftia tarda]